MKTSRVDNTVPLEQIQQLLLVLFLLLDQASKSPARSGPRLTVIMRLTTIAPVALATSGPISEDLEAMGAAMAASNDQNVSATTCMYAGHMLRSVVHSDRSEYGSSLQFAPLSPCKSY